MKIFNDVNFKFSSQNWEVLDIFWGHSGDFSENWKKNIKSAKAFWMVAQPCQSIEEIDWAFQGILEGRTSSTGYFGRLDEFPEKFREPDKMRQSISEDRPILLWHWQEYSRVHDLVHVQEFYDNTY